MIRCRRAGGFVVLCCSMLFLAACSGGGGSGTGSGTASTGWSAVGSADFTPGEADFTSLAIDASDTLYLAYKDNAKGHGGKATVMKFAGSGSSWTDVGSPDFSGGRANYTSLAINPNSASLYVSYQDAALSSKVMVDQFNGASWSPVPASSTGISTGEADSPSIAISSAGTLYIAYADCGTYDQSSQTCSNGERAAVKQFNGTSWVSIGSADFSPDKAFPITLAVSPTKNYAPYVAYIDGANNNRVTVETYENKNNSWADVGSRGFSSIARGKLCLAIASNGTPYVAYEDSASHKATVEKYNGSSWVVVGKSDFTPGTASNISLAIDATGTTPVPYLAYSDSTQTYKATVEEFNGKDWEPVGSPGLTPGIAIFNSLALDSHGIPHLAYQDEANGNKATVQSYTGP